jgi:hypothetical protein
LVGAVGVDAEGSVNAWVMLGDVEGLRPVGRLNPYGDDSSEAGCPGAGYDIQSVTVIIGEVEMGMGINYGCSQCIYLVHGSTLLNGGLEMS